MRTRILSLALMSGLLAASENMQIETGSFSPTWEGLSGWQCPEWFKDAKFGIWAHWGPQCQAEAGDWYGRGMYQTGSSQNVYHTERFGTPAKYGLKELCRDWKAEKWDPEKLIELYKGVGARYFFTLGQHHDNFDLWDSPYQQWNSVNVGPHRDIVKEWSEACRKNGLPFGISMHGSHTWTWLEPAQDYDGNLTTADGVGQWWEGLDPQELYAQNHRRCADGDTHWEWSGIGDEPSDEYKQKFVNRVVECVNRFNPDLLYFDDTVLPFYYLDNQIGLDLLAHYYNHRANQNQGVADVVATGKVLNNEHKTGMLWDVERGVPNSIQDEYWQTCTCIGSWHYDRSLYEKNGYKDALQVIDILLDVISKNGNLLLSVPIRGDGSLDEKELSILDDLKSWLDQNGTAIYATRPWKTFGEGPQAEKAAELNHQGFNESNDYSAQDVRYVQRDGNVYAFILRWPQGEEFSFESLGFASPYYSGRVKSVELIGSGDVNFVQDIDDLTVEIPSNRPNSLVPTFRISFDNEDTSWLPYAQYRQALDALMSEAKELLDSAKAEPEKYNQDVVSALDHAYSTAEAINEMAGSEALGEAYYNLKRRVSDFKANGLKKETVSGGKFNIWSGSVTGDGVWTSVKIAPTMFNHVHEGDKIVFTVENITGTNDNGGTWSGLQLYNREPWSNLEWVGTPTAGQYEVQLTENALKQLVRGGMEIEPRYLTIVDVTLDSGKDFTEKTIDDKTYVFGNTPSDYWLPANLFKEVSPGDAVVFHVEEAYDGQEGELYLWSSARVTDQKDDVDFLAGKNDLSQIDGDFGIVLTRLMVEALSTNGLKLTGRDFKLEGVSIQYLNDNETGIRPSVFTRVSSGDNNYYDLLGRVVTPDTKGILIYKGEKIIVR